MTNAIPIRVVVDGSGDTTGLSEFRTNETVGLNHGGTGATNAADARTNLGLADIAASGSWADLLNKPNTDEVPEGTTNLYFTDERVDDRVAALIVDGVGIQKNYDDGGNLLNIEINFSEFDTDDIIEGSVNTFLANRSTSDIPEGINLYFTDERVDDRVAALFVDGKGIQKAYDDAGNLLNLAIDFSEFDTDDIVEGTVNTFLSNRTTDDINEGTANLYYTDERVDDRVANLIVDGVGITKNYDDAGNLLDIAINFTEFDSDDIVEGAVNTFLASRSTDAIPEGSTNLYYTDARTDARIALQSGSNLDLSNKTTTDLAEGINLYFTDERVDDRVANLIQAGANVSLVYDDVAGTLTISATEDNLANNTTDDLAEGSNLYYTDARVDARITASNPYDSSDFDTDFATKSTTDLSEGTNLYYTDARVRTHIQGTDLDMGSNKILFSNVYANIGDLPSASSYHGMFAHVHGTGKAYYAHAGNWIELANQSELPTSTDDVSEGSTNLYYTDARVDSNFAAKTTTDLTEGTNLYYTDARVDARIAAANIVSGSSIDDLSDVDTSTTTPTDGQALVWDNTNSKWVPGASAGSSIDVSDIAPSSPSDGDLWFDSSELKTYIYYNDGTSSQWVEAAGNVASNVHLSDAAPSSPSEGDLWFNSSNLRLYVYYNDGNSSQWIEASGSVNSTDFDTDFATKSTTDLSEGTNLYYTDTRVQTKLGDVSGHIIPDTDVAYDLGSSTHKFRDLYLSGNSIILGGITLTESSGSLLVTPTAGGSNNTFATETFVNTAIANLVDTAPTTLDTLNELAAALGDDANFSTTITNSIATKLATADFNTTADSWLTTKSTTNLSEGTNLYYTDTRADARVNLQTGTNLDLSSKTTTDLVEGINLYYTQARFDSAFTAKSTTDLSEGTNLYYTDTRVQSYLTAQGIAAEPQWQEQSAAYTASAGDKLFVDCSSSAVTVTLPLSPTQGDEIRIIDATGNASINNITINRNGSNIQGTADNLIIETDRAAFGLVYYNTTQGWLLMER